MKAIVIFILSIFLLHQDSSAQTVFAPKGAVWNFFLDNDGIGSNFKYEVEKDTILVGRLCSKINSQRIDKSLITNLKPVYFCTSGDTVLYYHDSLKSFTPLYIFNVKVGDTITLAAPRFVAAYLDTASFRVKNVEITIIDGMSLRTVYTEPLGGFFYMPKYTERIGAYSVANIFGFDGIKTAMHTEGIRCYRDKEIEEQFYNDKWDCDYVPNEIKEQSPSKSIHIYPNPASKSINVHLSTALAKGQLLIMSLEGKVVFQKMITSSENLIDISHLVDGLYILQVKNEQELFTQKIIVAQDF